jgi:hypothetical protein
MTFNKCSIAGKCYGDLIDEATNEVLEITEVGYICFIRFEKKIFSFICF